MLIILEKKKMSEKEAIVNINFQNVNLNCENQT